MRFVVLASLLSLSLCSQIDNYDQYLVFAAKNHFRSVSQYAESIGFSQLDSRWEQFKINFDRRYDTPEEEELRKFNFLKSLQFIESHNENYKKGIVSHEVAVNHFSDWSAEEYNSMLGSHALNLTNTIVEKPDASIIASLPASFDWRTQGKVTPIKNQGTCGSCWAFATTATIESAYAIRHKQAVSLSEQQLVDCDRNNHACQFGNVGYAMQYVQNYGLEAESQYRYVGQVENCMNNGGAAHYRISGYRMLTHMASDQEIKTAIYNNGPVAVNIDASGNDFQYYRSGIINTGTRNMNHYVTAVGWGPGYWIIKNSWGTQWGESGFGQIATGNVRGFNNWLFYPIV